MSKSIVTEYTDISAISGKPAECRHHLVFGRGIRNLAEQDGLWVPLTNDEHNMGKDSVHGNPIAERLSKIAGQLAWEKAYYMRHLRISGMDLARQEFRKRYGKSYL